MLSKIKSSQQAAPIEVQRRSSSSLASESDEELLTIENNDTNNNNNNNLKLNNNNNNNQQQQQQVKNSQDELLDIVEVSRKRRLSRDSAESLIGFIRWSFTQMEPSIQRFGDRSFKNNEAEDLTNNNNNHRNSGIKSGDDSSQMQPDCSLDAEKETDRTEADSIAAEEEEEEEGQVGEDAREQDEDEERAASDWRENILHQQLSASMKGQFQLPEHLLFRQQQQQSKLANAGSSAAILAASLKVDRSNQLNHHMSLGSLLSDGRMGSDSGGSGAKRLRTQLYSSDARPFQQQSSSRKSSSNYLGNVVERLHNQQQQQQQQNIGAAHQVGLNQKQHQHQRQPDLDEEKANDMGLSFHLQQFLQQQTSLEDLCSSVGLDDGNQLVLAAAIHRALLEHSVGSSNQLTSDSKSVAANHSISSQQVKQLTSAPNANNLHLADSTNRQRRAYNTRAALQSAAETNSASGGLGNRLQAQQQQQQQVSVPSSVLLAGSRFQQQQQRHAQAAAALSALASAGVQHSHLAHPASVQGKNHLLQNHNHQYHHHSQHAHHNHQHLHHNHQHLHHNHQQLNQLNQQVLAAVASGAPTSAAVPMVEFKCDTCPSSFDDRHRLMQHQSIHLELKKDWFTETPVDEVMKIFNRRRGEFLCNLCNLRFEATLDYDQHNHQVHGPRPYCCQFCGNGTRTFKCWRQYLNHLYDHRYIFSCTIDDCDFTVNRRDSLRFHIFRFHLNCQLPQNQLSSGNGQTQRQQLEAQLSNSNLADSARSRWPPTMIEEDAEDSVDDCAIDQAAEDTEDEMNVAD